MKKLAAVIVLVLVCVMFGNVAQADIFGPQAKAEPEKALKLSASAPVFPPPDTLLDTLGSIVGYLGSREGVFYDFSENEFCNYLGATLYTYKPANIALNVGLLNADGGVITADWNIGAVIPAEDVPIMNLLKYLYVGGGFGSRYLDDDDGGQSWHFAYGIDAQFKVTF